MNSDKPKKEILTQARILWDYMKLGQPLQKADCVIAMGSHDLRVAEYAAQLVFGGWAPLLVCSGGLGRLTDKIWHEPEARKFARVAENAGIPKDQILIEDQSANTAENLRFSRELLASKKIYIHSAILVHKPYMERRVWATVKIVWLELECLISSPPLEFLEYPNQQIPMEDVIQIMVGDFQRILIYAERGFQTPQVIPSHVMDAFAYLVKAGYDHHCVKI